MKSGTEKTTSLIDDLDLPDATGLAAVPEDFLAYEGETSLDTRVEYFHVPDLTLGDDRPVIDIVLGDLASEETDFEAGPELNLNDLIVDIDHSLDLDTVIFPEVEGADFQRDHSTSDATQVSDTAQMSSLTLDLDMPGPMIVIDDEPGGESVAF